MTSPVRVASRWPGNARSIAAAVAVATRGSPDAALSLLRGAAPARHTTHGSDLMEDMDRTGGANFTGRRSLAVLRPERDDRLPFGRRSFVADDGAISPAGRVPGRGRSLMVARFVTPNEISGSGPFARSGVRSEVRGRRPDDPGSPRLGVVARYARHFDPGNEREVPVHQGRWSEAHWHRPGTFVPGARTHRLGADRPRSIDR